MSRQRSRSRGPTWSLVVHAAAVVAVPLVLYGARTESPMPAAASAAPIAAERAAADPLVGLWSAHPIGPAAAPVRFYYFHGDGHGLYRYGRVGRTNTNSFDYAIEGDVLVLRFRKTGAEHRIRYQVEQHGDRTELVLEIDPRQGGEGRFVRERPDPVEHVATGEPVGVGGRMWFDRSAYATGGYGFALYQLRPAGIDGRGTGWFHRGDFDDWSTESLVYRDLGDRLELDFDDGSHEITRHTITPGEARVLELATDPRDYWHPHRYVDAGPSFGVAGDDDLAAVTSLAALAQDER